MPAIKAAGLSDLNIIHNLAHEIWPDAYREILSREQMDYMLEKIYSLNSLQIQFTDLGHQFILVSDNSLTVGFASFSKKEQGSAAFRLHKIYILPDQKGKGTGKFILDHITTTIRELGGTSLELNVNRQNSALNFYKSQGFKIIREENIDIGEGYFMNDFVMEKKL